MWFKLVLAIILLSNIVLAFPDGRVVNGTNSDITKYNFMVSLRSASGSHSCGSTIIAPRWILTAAHCVYGKSPSQISIQYASTRISSAGPNIAYVNRIIVHEHYSPVTIVNDVALLELAGALILNGRTLDVVELPEADFEIPQVPEGAPGVLAGWGLNETGGYIQTTLQEVNLKIFSDEECYTRHEGRTNVDQICGGVDEGGKGQCSGDSGGPLLLDGRIQLGIVSWSVKPCTVYPFPGVYTKVSHFINWIHQNANF